MTITPERRGGLGRGLGELFQRTDLPPTPATEHPAAAEPLVPVPSGSSYADLPLDAILNDNGVVWPVG